MTMLLFNSRGLPRRRCPGSSPTVSSWRCMTMMLMRGWPVRAYLAGTGTGGVLLLQPLPPLESKSCFWQNALLRWRALAPQGFPPDGSRWLTGTCAKPEPYQGHSKGSVLTVVAIYYICYWYTSAGANTLKRYSAIVCNEHGHAWLLTLILWDWPFSNKFSFCCSDSHASFQVYSKTCPSSWLGILCYGEPPFLATGSALSGINSLFYTKQLFYIGHCYRLHETRGGHPWSA